MYRQSERQLTVYEFILPFSGVLSLQNRWVRLADEIDWCGLEDAYAAHFAKTGKQAIGARCAFGSLVIKKVLGLSDQQTVLLIGESPYLQYFIGLTAFCSTPPFAACSMSHFRRRIPAKAVAAAAKRMEEMQKKTRPKKAR